MFLRLIIKYHSPKKEYKQASLQIGCGFPKSTLVFSSWYDFNC
jgi:hypothetical protein